MSATPSTLWKRWQSHAARRPEREAIVHVRAGLPPIRIPWSTLVGDARLMAAQLAARGVDPGDVCALMLRHHPQFYALYLGVVARGAIPAVLAYPNSRLHPDKLMRGLHGMARTSGLRWVLTERELERTIAPLVTAAGSTVRGILLPWEWDATTASSVDGELGHAQPESPCLLQHSSGTTGLQKAVVLSHAAVLGHIEHYAQAIAADETDKVVSWLPLYHDMGLIAAFHLPLALGLPVVQLDPFEWIAAPYLLVEAFHSERATLCWLPNFAYNFMTDRVRDEDIAGMDLASVRMLINCSEPVRSDSHERFLDRFAAIGLRAEALSAAYAMAETTFAITQSAPGKRARELSVSREALARGTAIATTEPNQRRCVSSGAPIRDCSVRVVDADGNTLGAGQVGELWLQSPSMFDGYRNQPEMTRTALQDGWYRSGDLGFVLEGEVFVIGRKKDIIIVAGKNLSPEDIEDVCSAVPGVLAGRVVAFGIDDVVQGTELVCVVAETELVDSAARRDLRLSIVKAAMAIDVTVQRVELAPPRWLIKSSSGKLSRQDNRARLLAGELPADRNPP